MEVFYDNREFEIEKSELHELIKEEYKNMMEEQQKQGIIPADFLFGVLDGMLGGKSSAIPICFACGSFQDYTGQCDYCSKVRAEENGNRLRFCKKDDVPAVRLIEAGKLDSYELKGGGKND